MRSPIYLLPVLSVLLACGGSASPRAKSADEATTTSATAAAEGPSVDMPPAPAVEPAAASAASTEPAAPAAKRASMKIVALSLTVPPKEVKKAGFKALEVKDDGTILKDGKPVMTITESELRDQGGATLYAVSSDGSVTETSGKKLGRFSKDDELVFDGGGKLAVSEDGILQRTDETGSATALAPKFDAAPAWAKREAVLVALALSAGPLASAANPSKSEKAGYGKK